MKRFSDKFVKHKEMVCRFIFISNIFWHKLQKMLVSIQSKIVTSRIRVFFYFYLL